MTFAAFFDKDADARHAFFGLAAALKNAGGAQHLRPGSGQDRKGQ